MRENQRLIYLLKLVINGFQVFYSSSCQWIGVGAKHKAWLFWAAIPSIVVKKRLSFLVFWLMQIASLLCTFIEYYTVTMYSSLHISQILTLFHLCFLAITQQKYTVSVCVILVMLFIDCVAFRTKKVGYSCLYHWFQTRIYHFIFTSLTGRLVWAFLECRKALLRGKKTQLYLTPSRYSWVIQF